MPPPILLYDGICRLCNRLVQFILRRDTKGTFRFASLQSRLAAEILSRHDANMDSIETVCIVLNHDESTESLLLRSDAVRFVLRQLGGIWWAGAFVIALVPPGLRDRAYNMIAHNRYRIFGRYDSCPLPNEADRARFLGL